MDPKCRLLDVWRQIDPQDDQLLRFTILTPDLALERRLYPEQIRNYDPVYWP